MLVGGLVETSRGSKRGSACRVQRMCCAVRSSWQDSPHFGNCCNAHPHRQPILRALQARPMPDFSRPVFSPDKRKVCVAASLLVWL